MLGAELESPGRSCPRCGGTLWDPLVDWRKRVGFSVSHIACARCGLVAMEVGLAGGIVAASVQETNAHVRVLREDVDIEWIEPKDERCDVLIGVRMCHRPTGIVVEARSHDLRSDNERAALQALALQLVERERMAR